MEILVVTDNYPNLRNPNRGAFVYNLIQEIGKKNNISIISPFKLHEVFKKKHLTYGEEICSVYRPIFISLSNKKIGPINTGELSSFFFKRSAQRILNKINNKPDIIYIHFLHNVFPIIEYANKNNIPVVVASGESTYTNFESQTLKKRRKLIDLISQIICVSNENKEQLVNLGFDSAKISVIPNAVNYDLFKPINKNVCKEKLGVNSNKFVVGFIGHFIHRKGPNRIIEAIKSLNNPNIHLVCVGDGGGLKDNNFTSIIPPVANEQLPEIYNAFDVFVLPTLHEGSCNVIEEAKACCLPIISSKGTSVEEQIIHKETGILIDPLNINEIALNIEIIKNDASLRNYLRSNLKKQRGENSLIKRAEKISKKLQKVILNNKR